MHPLALALNETLAAQSPAVWPLLSEKGRRLYFPKTGILGQSAEAKGKRWNATIGIATEDDGSPLHFTFLDALTALSPKEVYPYASSYGLPELRAVWHGMMSEKNPSLKGVCSVPVVTCALTHGLRVAADVFINAGEKILLPDLFWGNYRLLFEELGGATLETFKTFSGDGLNLEAMKEALSRGIGKKVLLLNFPNNPCGYTPTEAEAKHICTLLHERAEAGDDLVVLLDDAYFGLTYEDGVYRESLFAPLSTLHERVLAVKLDGPTKEDYAWGLRVGFISVAGKALTQETADALADKIAGAVRGSVSNAAHVSQSLLLRAYKHPAYASEKTRAYALLRQRYEAVKQALQTPEYAKHFRALPFNSGYFMCVELLGNLQAEAVRKHLLEKYDTGVIATGKLLRIAFSAVATDQIATVFANIHRACDDLSVSS